MRYIKTYESYKTNKLLQEDFDRKIAILHNVELGGTDEELFKRIFDKVVESIKDESIKQEIKNYVSESELLNEGFFDKLKERFPKAAEVSKSLSDKAEGILSGILQKVKDAVSFVKKMTEGISEFFKMAIEKGKAFYMEQLKTGQLKAKVDELVKTKKEGLKADIITIENVLDFYRRDFMGKINNTITTNLTNFLTKEQTPIAESMLNEGGNVISTLVHGIEAIPPFSWLEALAKSAEKGAAAIINALSSLTQKLGGEAFQLPVIAILIGLLIEQIIKGQAGHWLLELAGPTPLGMAIKGIKMTASIIAFIVAVDSVIGGQLGVVNGHGHDDHAEHGAKPETEGEEKPEVEGETPQAKPEGGEAPGSPAPAVV
jgi:hypothetical protein